MYKRQVDEYKAKIEEVTSGKVSREAVSEEESDDNDSNSQSSDSGDKSSSCLLYTSRCV